MIITITLPWPPACLNPNAKRGSHWSTYFGPSATYKKAAWVETLAALKRRRFEAQPAVEVHFYPPDARSRDDDNTVGAFKAGRDGVAQALGHDDSNWRPSYHHHAPHRPKGKVVVILSDEVAG